MAPGDVVTIYEDPLTETREEGRAELVKPLGALDVETALQRWLVAFEDDEGEVCPRAVRVGRPIPAAVEDGYSEPWDERFDREDF